MTATKIFLHKILNSFLRVIVVGLGRLELPTSPLSGVRSNQAELQTHLRGARILLENSYLRKAFKAQIIGPDNTYTNAQMTKTIGGSIEISAKINTTNNIEKNGTLFFNSISLKL